MPPGLASAGVRPEEGFVAVDWDGPEGRRVAPDDPADFGRLEARHPLRPGVDGRPTAAGVEEGGERPLLHIGVGAENLDHLAVGEDHVVNDVAGGTTEVGAALHAGNHKTEGL